MLKNTFTPSEIASTPDLFFGRDRQLNQIETSLAVGSVLIQGAVGIGKSSLVARSLDVMAGRDCEFVTSTLNASVLDIESAARVVLDSVAEFTADRPRPFRLKVGVKFGLTSVEPTIEIENRDAERDFKEGRYLASLQKILVADHSRRRARGRRLLILGIDEADKAASAIAQLIRAVMNHLQQQGVRDVRFLVAGVSPIQQQMIAIDPGVGRLFNRVITLEPLSRDESDELVTGKLSEAASSSSAGACEVDSDLLERIPALAGGHPHVLQLLGSHTIQHENENPDGRLGLDDLVGALQRICYEDRGHIYASLIHALENSSRLFALKTLLGLTSESPAGVINEGFPTTINRQLALKAVSEADIQHLVEQGLLVSQSSVTYGLADQFVRVRLVFDDAGVRLSLAVVEQRILREGRLVQAGYDEWERYEEGLTGRRRDQ